MTQLTDEQRQALEQHPGQPIYVIDTQKADTYVLLPADDYHRVRSLITPDDFPMRETYAVQDDAAERAWDHPDDAAYDAEHSSPPA